MARRPPGADADPLLRADRAPAPRTLVDVLRSTADDHPDSPAIDNGREVLTYDELLASAGDVADRPARRGRRPGRPGGRAHPVAARPTSTSRSSASCWPARPTCRSTPTTRTSGRALVFGEAGVAAVVTADLVILSTEDAAAARRPRRTPDLTDDAWIIFTSGSTGHPQGRRGQPPRGRGLRRRRGADVPAGQADRAGRPGHGRAVRGVRRVAARRCGSPGGTAPASCRPRARWCAVGMDLGPWLVANGITVVSTVPTLAALWPAAGPGRRAPAHPRRRGLPARDRRPAGDRRARGLEHLRPHRGHRRRVRRPADRRAAGADRAAPRRLGPRRRRRRRAHRVADGETGRADHRRRRPGPLPRPGQGRREVYAPMPTPGLGPGLPQRRPRAVRRRGAGLRRPGRRPGQGRWPADRARRGRQRPARAPRGERGRGGGAPQRARATACSSATSRRRPAFDAEAAVEQLRAHDAGRARPAPGRRRRPARPAPPGKIDRDALPWPPPARPGATASDAAPEVSRARRAWVAGHWAAHPRRRPEPAPTTTSSTSAAAAWPPPSSCRAARALPRGHRRRRLRPPAASPSWPRRSTTMATPTGRAERRRCCPVPLAHPGRPGARPPLRLPLDRRLRWLTGSALAAVVGRGGLGLDWLPDVGWWVGAARLAAAGQPARPDRCWAPRRARLAAARGRGPASTRAAAACTCGSGLAERLVDELGAANLSAAPWIVSTRARSGAKVGRARRPAQRPARSPGCSPWATAARSSPRST